MQTYIRNVSTLKLNRETCIGCGLCVEVCPRAVLALKDRKAIIETLDACIECGACAKNCPVNALAVGKGTGCAIAVMRGALLGTEPDCDCESGCCGG